MITNHTVLVKARIVSDIAKRLNIGGAALTLHSYAIRHCTLS